MTEYKIKAADPLPFDKMKEIVGALIEKSKYKKALMLAIPSYLMIRFSDYSRLKWGDFDKERIIMIEKKTENTRKVKKPRIIKVGSEIKSIVKKCKPEWADKNDLIFSKKGENKPFSIQYVNKEIKRIGEEFNLNIEHLSSHSCIKSGCCKLYNRGGKSDAALLLVCKIRGHSNTGITAQYLGISQKILDNAYESM